MAKARNAYLYVISLVGLGLIAMGILALPGYERWLNLVWLGLLALAAQGTITFTVRGGYLSVASAISLSTVPLYGPLAAVLIAALAEVTPWLISIRQNPTGWRGALERLGFNVGMSASATFLAGHTFVFLQNWLGVESFAGQVLPWLPAAFIGDQVNLALLMGILYLANGVRPREAWKEHRWAIPINLAVTSIGGGVLAIAVRQFDVLGIAIFALPIILSSYAFRLFVNRTKEQMDKLEELVARRTQELAEANAELVELNTQKDAFLAVLTHDMRSPLTSIHGFATMLRDRPELPHEQRDRLLSVILRSEQTLLEIVNNILDIEKLQSGAPILLEREHVDLGQLLGEVTELVQGQAMEKRINLTCDTPLEPIFVQGDRQKLRRVVLNLVANAVKYTAEKGWVAVSVARNGQHALMDVSDNGFGIPADELPFIFDRFRRVAAHKGQAVGTGLGLAIVKSLVEAHDGTVEVVSEENVGSTFTVKLPL